ncbi:MAG: flippase-like domain-containing protein [Deltaproteobacteria bacterium]|nr:flippase-like domain-containing protein [Deltaproteobacteria bacterium]
MNRKLVISLMLGAAISTGGLYLAFKNIPFAELWGYLVTINYFWLLPAAAMVMLGFILRVLRWQIILGSARKVAFWPAFHPLMIAFMINTILPGRVGELARPAILQKNQGIRYSTGLATVAAERALDIIVIITLFFVVMNMVRIDPSVSIAFGDYQLNRETLETIAGGLARLSLVLIVGMVMVSVNASRNWINKLIMKAPSQHPGGQTDGQLRFGVCNDQVSRQDDPEPGAFNTDLAAGRALLCCFCSGMPWNRY